MPRIGQLQEKSLHAALKTIYARPGDSIETLVQGYVIDVVREDTLIEIQTRHFSALKTKLARLLETHRVRLVHPIARVRWIVRVNEDGEMVSRRKSPRRGTIDLLFRELIRFPELVAHPNFSIEIVFTEEEEVWHNDGQGSWRRKRWSIADRRLLSIVEQTTFETPEDFRALLPEALPQPFTTADLAAARGCSRSVAQKMAFCLRQMRVIEITGKRGNTLLYRMQNS